jgi:hypothetical protein
VSLIVFIRSDLDLDRLLFADFYWADDAAIQLLDVLLFFERRHAKNNVIVDVDPDEAQTLIELVETLSPSGMSRHTIGQNDSVI